MNELLTIIIGGGLSLLTELIGRKFPATNNLFVLAIIILIASTIGYTVFYFFGNTVAWQDMTKIAAGSFAWATAAYQIVKNIKKNTEPTA
jgi:hypothetical protein